jgi:hypothetical protein
MVAAFDVRLSKPRLSPEYSFLLHHHHSRNHPPHRPHLGVLHLRRNGRDGALTGFVGNMLAGFGDEVAGREISLGMHGDASRATAVSSEQLEGRDTGVTLECVGRP